MPTRLDADFSQSYYDRPARFAPEVADIFVRTVAEMLGRPFAVGLKR